VQDLCYGPRRGCRGRKKREKGILSKLGFQHPAIRTFAAGWGRHNRGGGKAKKVF